MTKTTTKTEHAFRDSADVYQIETTLCPRCGGPSEAIPYAGPLLCLQCTGPRYTEQDELERRIAFVSANPGADFEALILAEQEDEGMYD